MRPDEDDLLASATRLHLEQVTYDTHFGSVSLRPGAAGHLAREIRTALDTGDGLWFAERAARPVAFVSLQPPPRAGWAAPLVAARAPAYLGCLAVAEGERGRGVGVALADLAPRRGSGERRGRRPGAPRRHEPVVRPVLAPTGPPPAVDDLAPTPRTALTRWFSPPVGAAVPSLGGMNVVVGLQATVELVVDRSDTAGAVGSGDVPVLATPRLLTLAEAATVAALAGRLAPATTTVGNRVELEHLLPSPVGERVAVRATLVEVDGRRLRFEVRGVDGRGELIARGGITRVVVDRARFLTPPNPPSPSS
ncbi:thioesterase, FlK family [Streptoalloteichus hindustanus]|uniref:Predicted thioesterase n=1 Tax=Streptoalloteichus hindustanus TaxID=2017 RepID=A0A1M4TLZ4_STRHI|nr:GNAT family N-acetyltransferase [Streptoalloteichus hindustanus]SHE45425.1 Predicted thioesterase [Streptoalloteichus hindustanus]